MSFSTAYVQKRTSKNTFYSNVNIFIDCQIDEKEIVKYCDPGRSATGQRAYSGLLLFKMLLVGIWNGGLSDRNTEEMVCENLSAMAFCGLALENDVPDHSCLSRFRTDLAKNDGFEAILTCINDQLDKHGILVKQGIKVDASLTDTLRKPKGKTTYKVAEDRKEDEFDSQGIENQVVDAKAEKVFAKGVDTEAKWLIKGGKMHYGYKKHVATDDNGLVVALITTAANEHDSKCFEDLIEKSNLAPQSRLYADKAYKTKKNDEILKVKKIKNGIHYKAVRGKRLTDKKLKFNKLVSKTRYTVERTFGSINKWFTHGIAKYVGRIKTHAQHLIESIAYNLKRSPRLIVEHQIRNSNRLIQG